MDEFEQKVPPTVASWIVSLAISIACCAVLFVVFGGYLMEIKKNIAVEDEQLQRMAEHEEQLLSEIKNLHHVIVEAGLAGQGKDAKPQTPPEAAQAPAAPSAPAADATPPVGTATAAPVAAPAPAAPEAITPTEGGASAPTAVPAPAPTVPPVTVPALPAKP